MRNIPKYGYKLTLKEVNKNLIKAHYPICGMIIKEALDIQSDLTNMDENKIRNEKYFFDKVVELNIENPQALNYQPMTFNRQVLACLVNTELFNMPNINEDAKNRAKFYHRSIGSIGAYSDSPGFPLIRKQIAQFIQRRDLTATEVETDHIILTDGATQAAALIIATLLKDPSEGMMIPAPCYPFYPSFIEKQGSKTIPYFLNDRWTITKDELQASYRAAVRKGVKPKAIVIINPGNPTGHVFSKNTLENIIRFAQENKVIIIADEVYQDNVYTHKFISMRKVRDEMPAPYNYTELFSIHSASKGFMSECGFRGGYMQISEIDYDIINELLKAKVLISESNNIGQVALGLMTSPPTREEGCSNETIETYWRERTEIIANLKQKSEIVVERLNDCRGVYCEPIQGSIFAFPRIDLSAKFIEESKKQGFKYPDEFYCLSALKEIGVVLLPGSGFLQKPDTHHFRMSVVTKTLEELNQAMIAFRFWHERFMKQYQ